MGGIKNIVVVGGTGFTGTQVLKQLEEIDNIKVTCIVRSSHKKPIWNGKNPLNILFGDLDDPASLDASFKDQDAMIFVASMGFGHMEIVVRACEKNGINRAVFTSSTAIFTRLPAQSVDGRETGEKAVMSSSINWTILRPTMIFGRIGDRNTERLVKNLKKFPFFFIPGPGKALQQPIFVDDVAKATIQALLTEKSVKKAYNISGADYFPFNEMVKATAQALNKNIWIINLPLFPMQLLVRLYNVLSKTPKLSEEQILRLNEDKAFDHNNASNDFDFSPISFAEGVKNLIKELS